MEQELKSCLSDIVKAVELAREAQRMKGETTRGITLSRLLNQLLSLEQHFDGLIKQASTMA